MSTRNSSGLCVIKSKLTPPIGYVVGAVKFVFFFFNNGNNQYSITTTAPITEYSKKKKKKKHDMFYLHC